MCRACSTRPPSTALGLKNGEISFDEFSAKWGAKKASETAGAGAALAGASAPSVAAGGAASGALAGAATGAAFDASVMSVSGASVIVSSTGSGAPAAVESEVVASPAPVANDVTDMVSPSAAPGGMPLEMRQALSALDKGLIAVLRSGDIRLVRASWLLAQPDSFHMPYRQELEALEASGVTPSPLLSPDEAVAIIEKGDRSACILS